MKPPLQEPRSSALKSLQKRIAGYGRVRPSGEKSAAELEEWSKAGKLPKNSELVQVFTP
jgi:hypothetical protein